MHHIVFFLRLACISSLRCIYVFVLYFWNKNLASCSIHWGLDLKRNFKKWEYGKYNWITSLFHLDFGSHTLNTPVKNIFTLIWQQNERCHNDRFKLPGFYWSKAAMILHNQNSLKLTSSFWLFFSQI